MATDPRWKLFVVLLVAPLVAFVPMSRGVAATPPTATEYALPEGSDPWGVAIDSSGNVWVAAPGCDPGTSCSSTTPSGMIEEFNPASSTWTSHTLPAGYGQALFLAFDTAGNLWFTSPFANVIGTLNPVTKAFQKWTVPTANSRPWDLTVDRHGRIWFTEFSTNKIARFDPKNGKFREIATPSPDSHPYGIAAGAHNDIWFTENNDTVGLVAETSSGVSLKGYKTREEPAPGLTPHLIAVDPDGNVWWTEGFATSLGELKTDRARPGTNLGVSEYSYSSGGHTSGIAIDHHGLVWFDDSLLNKYGSFPISGTGSFSVYPTPSGSGHPHDGLAVDSQDRIWIAEEFGNKLMKVTQ